MTNLVKIISKLLPQKKIFLNISYRFIFILISKLLSFITFPIIARALQPEVYGEWNLTRVVLSYVGFFVTFGFINYGIREIAAKPNENDKIVNQILSVRIFVVFISILISIPIIYFLYNDNNRLMLAIFAGFLLPMANAIKLDFFYFGVSDVILPSIADIIGQLIYVILIFFLINDPEDIILVSFLFGTASLVSSIFMIIKYYKDKKKIVCTFSLKIFSELFRNIKNIGFSTKLEFIQMSLPPIFISIILSNYALGLYSAAYKLFGLYVMFLGQVMIILAPYLTKLKNMDRIKSINYSIQFILLSFFFGALIGITFFSLTEEIILLILGDGFRESIELFKLINILLIPSWSVYMALGSILIYNNLDKYILKCSIISVIVLLISGPLFLYLFGLAGIIYSLVLSNLATIALSGYFIKKYFFSRLTLL